MSKNIAFLFALVPTKYVEHYSWTLSTAESITTTAQGVCLIEDLLNRAQCGIRCDMQKGLQKVRVPYVFVTIFTI